MDSALYFWKESNVKRACEAKLTPISVDFDAKKGVFPASKGSSTTFRAFAPRRLL